MPVRLVALDEGPDITIDRDMVIVGRHPNCDTRLDSLRVSRRHCCMLQDSGDVVVRDLGSTNGIRINGQRVEHGRLHPGDELSIAHIRYRVENGFGHEHTIAEPAGIPALSSRNDPHPPSGLEPPAVSDSPLLAPTPPSGPDENSLAAAVRRCLPAGLADKCRIQVIVQVPEADRPMASLHPDDRPSAHAPEPLEECHSNSSL